jgi:hypothetical protein
MGELVLGDIDPEFLNSTVRTALAKAVGSKIWSPEIIIGKRALEPGQTLVTGPVRHPSDQ